MPRCLAHFRSTLVLLFLSWLTPVLASESVPLFHIDSPTHVGRILRVALTADERHLVTAGFDHTVRLWETASGRPVQRWVLPNGDDRIHALALSPDGEWLAVGGDVSSAGEGAVLVIALRTGQIVRALGRLHARVGSLAFSPDGSLLAIGFAGPREVTQSAVGDLAGLIASAHVGGNAIETGLRIYRTTDWHEVFADPLSSGVVSDLAFGPGGRLAVGTQEAPGLGQIAVYANEGGRFLRVARADIQRHSASRLAWTADGHGLELAGSGIYSAADLAEQRGSMQLPEGQPLGIIRRASAGRYWLAASAETGRPGFLRVYDAGGLLALHHESRLPDAVINDLVAFADGRVAYVSDNGSVALLEANGTIRWRHAANAVALRTQPDRLRVSTDGEWVSLPYEGREGIQDTAFHLPSGRFSPVSAISGWREPLTGRRGLNLLAWRNSANGSANGNYFPFKSRGERSLSATVHSAVDNFYYGSDAGRLYKATAGVPSGPRYPARQSLMMWVRQLGADVVGINLIESRDIVIVATADGLLRVIRGRDGVVLLTYYLQPNERKWLAIAENGYYDASTGGEDLGGWVVSQNAAQLPEFFPMSRFRTQFLAPGLAREVLARGDVAAAVQAIASERGGSSPPPVALTVPSSPAEILPPESVAIAAPQLDQLPPTVDILSPGFEATATQPGLTIKLRVHTPPGAPVTRLYSRVISAGRTARGLHANVASEEQMLHVQIPPEDAEIQIVAENRWGSSVPKVVRVRYAGQKTAIGRGTLRILAIGVSEYDNPRYRLNLAAKDARDFGQLFSGQQGRLYEKVELHLLTDREAGKRATEKALDGLVGMVRPEDTTFVFLAGHGINDPRSGYYFMGRDADLERLPDTGVSFRKIRQALAELPGRNLLFVDTCHAGNVLGGLATGFSRNNSAAINEIASAENNIIVFASSSGDQESLENADWGNGAFTKALLEGLRGEADFKRRGRVTYKQLDAYVADRVAELTEGLQTPVTPVLFTVPDFPIAEVAR